MQEISSPLLVDPSTTHQNTTDILEHRLTQSPHHIAFETPVRDASGTITRWKPVTTESFARDVKVFAKGLIGKNVQPGDRVAIFAPTRYEWAVADLAIMYAGGIVIPIYETSSAAQITAILRDANVRVVFTETKQQRQHFEKAYAQHNISNKVFCLEDDWCINTLVDAGAHISDEILEERRTRATLDDVATIVYTSGTTSEPKGAKITHRNLVGQVLNVAAAYSEVVHEQGSTVIFLPLAHVLARGLQFACLAGGMRVSHLSDPQELIGQLPVIKPSFLVLVPRVLEKIEENISMQAEKKKLASAWQKARSIAIQRGKYCEDKVAPAHIPTRHRAQHALYNKLFYSRVRKLLGGNMDWTLAGGAPLNRETSLLFRGMGIPVIEGYGLTETTAPIAGNLPHNIRSGTVGVPLPGATIRVADSGEILVQGIGVFSGYTSAPATAEAFDGDFFKTGDTGSVTDGFLTLNGRVKDDILTSGGKSISPYAWENEVNRNPLVAHAVVVGEGRNYLTALIVPNEEALASSTLSNNEAYASIEKSVRDANALVARSEQVKKFAVARADLSDPTLVTPTQKLKRAVFTQRWAREIEQLYA